MKNDFSFFLTTFADFFQGTVNQVVLANLIMLLTSAADLHSYLKENLDLYPVV